jgi:DNA-binding FadR family transcriptional regulator
MVRRTASLAQQVAQEILSEIETGTLAREGGLLPSETDLSHRFGVSRATVREALSRLDGRESAPSSTAAGAGRHRCEAGSTTPPRSWTSSAVPTPGRGLR